MKGNRRPFRHLNHTVMQYKKHPLILISLTYVTFWEQVCYLIKCKLQIVWSLIGLYKLKKEKEIDPRRINNSLLLACQAFELIFIALFNAFEFCKSSLISAPSPSHPLALRAIWPSKYAVKWTGNVSIRSLLPNYLINKYRPFA